MTHSSLQEKDAKIAQLTAQVKRLELELVERVRGFLLQSRHKNARPTRDSSTQTQPNPSEEEFPSKAETSPEKQEEKIEFDLSYSPQQSEPQSDLSTPLKQECEPQLTTSSSVEKEMESFRSREAALLRQERKARKEIRNLKEQVRFLGELADIAREGLLRAEEENYQFRLQLQEMERKEDCTETAERDKQMQLILQDLQITKSELNIFYQAFGGQPQTAPTIAQHWNNLAALIHQTVSKIPLQGHCEDSVMFHPETIPQASTALKVLLGYAEAVERREEEWQGKVQLMRDAWNSAIHGLKGEEDKKVMEDLLSSMRNKDPSLFPSFQYP